MQIELTKPKTILIQEAVYVTESIVKILSVTDTFSSVNTMIQLGENMPSALVLWENESYNAIGQWTDEDVKKRILELI